MTPETFEILCRTGATPVFLHVIKTDRFKTARFSVTLSHPMTDESMIFDRLSIYSSLRETQKIPNILTANRILDDLYSAALSPIDYSVGAVARPGFCAEFLNSKYVPDGRDLLREVSDVMAEMLLHPTMTDKSIESERRNFVLSVKDEVNDPVGYAAIMGKSLLFEGLPFGTALIGRVEEIERITPDQVREYRKNMLDCSRIDFFFIGDAEKDGLIEIIREKFEGLGCVKIPELNGRVNVRTAGRRVRSENMPVMQSQMQIGFAGGYSLFEEKYAASAVFAELYGNMGNSRLYSTVREKLGLCYSVDARFFSACGAMIVECGTDKSSVETAKNEIFAQLENIKAGNITERELSDAKKSLLGIYAVMKDDMAQTEGFWSWNLLAGIKDTPEDICKRIRGVTAFDVCEAANRFVCVSDYLLCPGSTEAANG